MCISGYMVTCDVFLFFFKFSMHSHSSDFLYTLKEINPKLCSLTRMMVKLEIDIQFTHE